MITIEDVRAAVTSPAPTEQLDRLVHHQLAKGKTTAEIYAVLLPIVRTIRKSSPLPETLDEILLGMLDALTGDCDPDQCYRDFPATPTQQIEPDAEQPTPLAHKA